MIQRSHSNFKPNHRENYLVESVPRIDKTQAKHLARKLSSLKVVQRVKQNRSNAELKALFKKLLHLAEIKRENKVVDSHHQYLMKMIGEKKYNDILSIVQDIREIRHKSALWTKFSRDFSRVHKDRTNSGTLEEERASAASTIPCPIFDIYFRTRLVEAMQLVDTKSTALPEAINEVDWEDLLHDAKEKLQLFRKFEAENTSSDEELCFKCGSGLCSFRGCDPMKL